MVPSSMRIAQTTATPMATTKARMPSPGPAAAGGGGRAELYHSRLLLLNGKLRGGGEGWASGVWWSKLASACGRRLQRIEGL